MQRLVLRVEVPDDDGSSPVNYHEYRDVGDDWRAWNEAIGADTGELVRNVPRFELRTQEGRAIRFPNGAELWCDENARLTNRPRNEIATALAQYPWGIYGDVIVFRPGDVR